MITDTQIALVQSSFRHVLPIADAAGLLFYERIFTLAPGTRALFDDDIAPQAKRTMAAVKTAVDGLGRPRRRRPRSSSGWAPATCATAYGPSTSTSSARRCCGRSSRVSASVHAGGPRRVGRGVGRHRRRDADGHAPGRGRARAVGAVGLTERRSSVRRSSTGRRGRRRPRRGRRRPAAVAIIISATRL